MGLDSLSETEKMVCAIMLLRIGCGRESPLSLATSARAGYSSASLAIRLNTDRPHLMVVISLSSVSR